MRDSKNPHGSGFHRSPKAVPVFITDAMLGSLTRKLRIFGFDTTYHKDGSDEELISSARREHRIIMTSDRALSRAATRAGLEVILLTADKDTGRLRELVEESKARGLRLIPEDSFCALCNGALLRATRKSVSHELPEAVVDGHRIFFICKECGKKYWKGGHWVRLRRMRKMFVTDKRI